jgi:hypothetical protein
MLRRLLRLGEFVRGQRRGEKRGDANLLLRSWRGHPPLVGVPYLAVRGLCIMVQA